MVSKPNEFYRWGWQHPTHRDFFFHPFSDRESSPLPAPQKPSTSTSTRNTLFFSKYSRVEKEAKNDFTHLLIGSLRKATKGRAWTLRTIAGGKAPSTGRHKRVTLYTEKCFIWGMLAWILLPMIQGFFLKDLNENKRAMALSREIMSCVYSWCREVFKFVLEVSTEQAGLRDGKGCAVLMEVVRWNTI